LRVHAAQYRMHRRGPVASADVGLASPDPNRRHAHSPDGTAMPDARSALVADAGDLVIAGTVRGLELEAVAGVLADQRAGERRRHRDQPLLDVGLEVADDLVADLL